MKLFKEIEEQLGRKLTDREKTLVLIAYTIGKNEKQQFTIRPNLERGESNVRNKDSQPHR